MPNIRYFQNPAKKRTYGQYSESPVECAALEKCKGKNCVCDFLNTCEQVGEEENNGGEEGKYGDKEENKGGKKEKYRDEEEKYDGKKEKYGDEKNRKG